MDRSMEIPIYFLTTHFLLVNLWSCHLCCHLLSFPPATEFFCTCFWLRTSCSNPFSSPPSSLLSALLPSQHKHRILPRPSVMFTLLSLSKASSPCSTPVVLTVLKIWTDRVLGFVLHLLLVCTCILVAVGA